MDYKEKVIALLDSQELSDEQKRKLEEIFPELKESEGEMIRKDLLYWLYSYKDGNETFVPAGDVDVWISYLEKQCEQQDNSKFLDSIQIGDQVTRNEDGVLVNLSQLKRVAKTAEKQGEQKPEWSEEDERIFKDIQQIFIEYDSTHFLPNIANKYTDWLKSLRPQNRWKPSDEQMDALHYVTNFDYGGHKATLVSLYEQLKKLK